MDEISITDRILFSMKSEMLAALDDAEKKIEEFHSTPTWRLFKRKRILNEVSEKNEIARRLVDDYSFIVHAAYGDE